MLTLPANVASAGPVIEVMALFVQCRGPELNRRHMVLQVMRHGLATDSLADDEVLQQAVEVAESA